MANQGACPSDKLGDDLADIAQAAKRERTPEDKLVGNELIQAASDLALEAQASQWIRRIDDALRGPGGLRLVPEDRLLFAKQLLDASEYKCARHQLQVTIRDPRTSDSLRLLARVHLDFGKWLDQPSRPRIRPLNPCDLSPEHAITASYLLMRTGALDEAAACCTTVLEAPDLSKDIVASALVNLAGIELNRGHLGEAEALLDKVSVEDLGDDPEFVAVYLQNRALAATMRGFHFDAAWLLDAAVSTAERLDPNQATLLLSSIAEAGLILGDPEAVREIAQRALEIGARLPEASRCIAEWTASSVFAEIGDARADDLLDRAERSARQAKNWGILALAAIRRADRCCERGRLREAELIVRSARRLCAGRTDLIAMLCNAGGLIAVDRGHRRRAERLFLSAARGFAAVGRVWDESDAWDSVAQLQTNLRAMARFARRSVRVGYGALALEASARGRSEFRKRLRPHGALLVGASLALGKPAEAFLEAARLKCEDFIHLYAKRANENLALDPALVSSVRQAVAMAAAARSQVAGGQSMLRDVGIPFKAESGGLLLHRQNEVGSPLGAEREITLADLARRIPPRQALVEYFLTHPYDGELIIFILLDGQIRHRRVRWRVEDGETVENVIGFIAGSYGGRDPLVLRHLLGRLYGKLISPLGNLLEHVDRLIVATEASLGEIPFSCLFDEHQGRFLVDRVEITHLLSGLQIPHLPAFPERRFSRALVLRGSDSGGSALEFADRECREVRSLLSERRVRVLEKPRGASLSTIDLLHYAGHARFDPDSPELAALVFPARHVSPEDVATLPLRANPLVVLSACESGRPEFWTDEFGALLRSFFFAGASSVVCSGWLADDEASCKLMRSFYSHALNGESVSGALRAASRELRCLRPEIFHWGNFRCYGLS